MYGPYGYKMSWGEVLWDSIYKYKLQRYANIICVDVRHTNLYGFIIPKFYEVGDESINKMIREIIEFDGDIDSYCLSNKICKRRSTICILPQPIEELENTLLHELIHIVDVSRCPDLETLDSLGDSHNTPIWNKCKHLLEENHRGENYVNYVNELVDILFKH